MMCAKIFTAIVISALLGFSCGGSLVLRILEQDLFAAKRALDSAEIQIERCTPKSMPSAGRRTL